MEVPMSRRRLARSFVTVVAATSALAATACNPPPPRYAPNPPGIEPPPETPEGNGAVVLEPEPPEPGTGTPEPEIDPTDTIGPTSNPPPPELPEAKPGQEVRRGVNGKCWVSIDPKCPPRESGRTCNPPPPMEVRCPDEG